MHHGYHATHSQEDAQDMRNMGGLRRHLPITFMLMWVATLAIAGIAPLSGFFSKDAILTAAFARGAEQPVWYVIYGCGVLTALLTGIYMARLMAMTFHGANRTGEAAEAHLHEAPWIMTGPLVVLGILTVVGGALNVPHVLRGHEALTVWLEPVTRAATEQWPLSLPAASVEWALVGAAMVIGAAGLWIGYRVTLARPIPTAREAPPERGLARVLHRKYYVDEIYDALFVRPLVWLSDRVLWRTVDKAVVDGIFVHGGVFASRWAGRVGSRIQNGQVGVYAVLFVIGAVWVLHTILS
jgi:NADH-quinone oxidoreductase subunit L